MFDIVKIKAYLGICQMPDCCRPIQGRGLCQKHFQWYRLKDSTRRAEFEKYALSYSTSKIRIAESQISKINYYLKTLHKRNAQIFVTDKFLFAIDGDTVYRFTPDGELSKAKLNPA